MIKLVLAAAFICALGFVAPARAETVDCTAITSLPYVINAQGVYCFTGHLNTSITVGNAITINANNVIIDLNGYKLGGLSAGTGTTANGIYATQRANITIKNGTVRGFLYGIFLDDASPYTTSQGHIIEDVRADQNRQFGMYIAGSGNIVRKNQVVSTGGTTTSLNTSAFGLYIAGPRARVLDNDVIEVTGIGSGSAYGMFFYTPTVASSVVAGNRVSNIVAPMPAGFAFGIDLSSGTNYIVSDNRLSGLKTGIFFDASATGAYMNNLVRGATVSAFSGGTAAGSTNFASP